MIEFVHDGTLRLADIRNIRKGEVAYPMFKCGGGVGVNHYSPFRNIGVQKPIKTANDYNREKCRKEYEGKIYHTVQGYDIEIVDYMSVHNVIVRFVHDGYMKFTGMSSIKKGLVAYPFHPNKYGGYPGVGYYTQTNSKIINSKWFNMLERANSEEFSNNSRYRLYKKVTVCNEWLNFQNFAFWYDCYLSGLNQDPSLNYQIDKDIFQFGQEYKIYSPQTCCLIPKVINAAIESLQRERKDENSHLPKGVTPHKQAKGKIRYSARCSYGEDNNGVYIGIYDTPEEAFAIYKREKEKYIRELADYYLSIGSIYPNVHDALYKIDIKPFGE
jgi:hypothetical protein